MPVRHSALIATLGVVELAPSTAEVYIRQAFARMLQVADRVGNEKVNRRPLGPETNAVFGLVVHCCEVSEFWLGHVALGRPSHRDRDDEFSRSGTVAELHQLVEHASEQAVADIASLEAGDGRDEGGRQFLPGGDGSDAAVVIHVLEELFQHLGHMEIAADALGVS